MSLVRAQGAYGDRMTTKHYKMEDVEKCLICNKWIGKGHDPAVCSSGCLSLFKYEINFNRWAKKESEKEES